MSGWELSSDFWVASKAISKRVLGHPQKKSLSANNTFPIQMVIWGTNFLGHLLAQEVGRSYQEGIGLWAYDFCNRHRKNSETEETQTFPSRSPSHWLGDILQAPTLYHGKHICKHQVSAVDVSNLKQSIAFTIWVWLGSTLYPRFPFK